MGAVPKQKCHFYNRGFCKYKNQGCEYFHPEDSCVDPKCENRDCPKRHQQSCKFKEKSEFYKTKKFEFILSISLNVEQDTGEKVEKSTR